MDGATRQLGLIQYKKGEMLWHITRNIVCVFNSNTVLRKDKTLNDNDINPVHQDIIAKLIKEFDASIR